MTTDLARTFIDEIDQLPAEIPGAATLDPGRLAWLHGVNAGGAKTPGVFYAKDTAFTDLPGAPWTLDERYSEQGERGYSAPELHLAFIGERSQWFIPGATQGDPPTWILGYQQGAKKLTEYLVMVRGLDDPMVLSVSGMYKARPFTEIVGAYQRGLLTQAMRRFKRSLPLWTFWLPIANLRDGGKTRYLSAKGADGKEYGSVVTPPALYLPDDPFTLARTIAEIEAGAALWQEYQAWFKAKRLPRDTVEAQGYVVTDAPALPAPRNIPQPIGEEVDLPPF